MPPLHNQTNFTMNGIHSTLYKWEERIAEFHKKHNIIHTSYYIIIDALA